MLHLETLYLKVHVEQALPHLPVTTDARVSSQISKTGGGVTTPPLIYGHTTHDILAYWIYTKVEYKNRNDVIFSRNLWKTVVNLLTRLLVVKVVLNACIQFKFSIYKVIQNLL